MDSDIHVGLFEFLFGLVPFCAGIVILFLNFKNKNPINVRIKKATFLNGFALISWGIGSIIWSYYNLFLNIEAPFPSFVDVFYVSSTVLYVFGAINIAMVSSPEAQYTLINVKRNILPLAIVVSTGTYYMLLTIVKGGKFFDQNIGFLANTLNIVYPCIDFIGLVFSVIVARLSLKYFTNKYTLSLIFLSASLFLFFVSDSYFSFLIENQIYNNAGLSDLLYIFATTSLILGTLGFLENNAESNVPLYKE